MHNNTNTIYHDSDLDIYITHGSPSVIKGTANRISKGKPHIIATYKENEYTLLNAQALVESLQLDTIATKYTSEAFIAFIEMIKQESFLSRPSIMLCMDVNLGCATEEEISPEFFSLVEHIKPQFLGAFSGTPQCVDNLRSYLSDQETGKLFKNIHCKVSDQKGIGAAIEAMLNGVKNNRVGRSIERKELLPLPTEQAVVCVDEDKKNNNNKPVRTCISYFFSCFNWKKNGMTKIAPEISSHQSPIQFP